MAKQPESIEQLTVEFAKMPGIGTRTAARLAYYVQSLPHEEAARLADAILSVKQRTVSCSRCYNISESDPCVICSDATRDSRVVCVVEIARDLTAIEASGGYRGVYHVLGGRLAPLDGVYPEHLTVDALVKRVRNEGVCEIIIATNPDTEGDATANYVIEQLAPTRVKVSQLARGVPSGGQLEHAAKSTLANAIKTRQQVK